MKRLFYRVYTFLREHEQGCQFFDNFGMLIQGILGVICLLFLICIHYNFKIVKRFIEFPKRNWTVWFLDTTKQGIGQFSQHLFNLIVSIKIGTGSSLECEWYIVNLICDATIGILFQYIFLKITENYFKSGKYEFKSGEYSNEDVDKVETWNYIMQLVIWISVVIIVKNSQLIIRRNYLMLGFCLFFINSLKMLEN
jgi:hypothetical protein